MNRKIDKLIANYITNAIVNFMEIEESSNYRKANRAHDRVIKAFHELEKLGDEGINALIDLLDHSEDGVRLWAATHLLKYNKAELAIPVLEEISKGRGIKSHGAQMVLQEWYAGRLTWA